MALRVASSRSPSIPERARGEPMAVSTRSESGASAPLARLLAWVVLALMAAATAYNAWIALANFHRIGV